MTYAGLWTEELKLSEQTFKHLHGLLKHAQFKPLIGQRLWELSEVGTKQMGEYPSTPTSASSCPQCSMPLPLCVICCWPREFKQPERHLLR
jgi:hypothetical protein